MSERIKKCLNQLAKNQGTALIPFATAGDPDLALSLRLMHEMVDAGADILELGIPFSDPMAEGPVIQAACERALAQDVSLNKVLELVSDFRQQDQTTPIILMGYLNPIETMGYDAFTMAAAQAGVDGVIIVDLPYEESHDFNAKLAQQDIALIYLLAPTTSSERIKATVKDARGYLYYVSLKGVTGSSSLDIDAVAGKLAEIRQYTNLPITVGFGIRDADTAVAVSKVAEGVVIGSAIVSKIAALNDDHEAICREVSVFLRVIVKALHSCK